MCEYDEYQKLFVTDLDGTLLRSDRTVSMKIKSALKRLKHNRILRVIATGRSLYSLDKVIPPDFPIDYIVFSSGAGIYDFRQKKIVATEALSFAQAEDIVSVLSGHQLNFSIQEAIPDNHRFYYSRSDRKSLDFEKRIQYYAEFSNPIPGSGLPDKNYCQFIAISDHHDVALYSRVKTALPEFKVIRTTSPLNGEAIWIEIFPSTVSKASGIERIREQYRIDISDTVGVGNDYNDLDMLDYTANSFIVDNGATDLKMRYQVIPSNNQDGVIEAINRL